MERGEIERCGNCHDLNEMTGVLPQTARGLKPVRSVRRVRPRSPLGFLFNSSDPDLEAELSHRCAFEAITYELTSGISA